MNIKKMSKYFTFLLLQLCICVKLQAQITKFPYVENYQRNNEHLSIIQTEKTSTKFIVTFGIRTDWRTNRKINIYASGSPYQMVVIDKSNNKMYRSINQENKTYTVSNKRPIIFKVEFEPIPLNCNLIDLTEIEVPLNYKKDNFLSIHLDQSETRTVEENLKLFRANEFYDAIQSKDEFVANAHERGVVTMPQGWQYKVIKKGNGNFVDLNTINDYLIKEGTVEVKSIDGQGGKYLGNMKWEGKAFYETNNLKGNYLYHTATGYENILVNILTLMDEGAEWEVFIPAVGSTESHSGSLSAVKFYLSIKLGAREKL